MSLHRLPARQNPVAAVFRGHFEIQPRDAEMLAHLYVGRSEPIPRQDLAARSCTTHTSVAAHVGNLRDALSPAAIDHLWGKGYKLSAEGVAACEAAIEEARSALGSVA